MMSASIALNVGIQGTLCGQFGRSVLEGKAAGPCQGWHCIPFSCIDHILRRGLQIAIVKLGSRLCSLGLVVRPNQEISKDPNCQNKVKLLSRMIQMIHATLPEHLQDHRMIPSGENQKKHQLEVPVGWVTQFSPCGFQACTERPCKGLLSVRTKKITLDG